MYRLIRFLAVIALALSPVWGVQTVEAMHSAYPVWPSFLSTGCNGIQGPGGSTTIACGQGAFLLSQVNSGYACTTVFISVTQYQNGPFTVVGTANSGSLTNTVSIDATGDYYMQFQGYLTNNLIAVQISSPGGGAMTIGTIGTGPCPVPPTATPVPATNTPNPSDTATPVPDTATPGPSQTPTAISTFTPLPSGHHTFTPSLTPTPNNTGTVTPTPAPSYRDCGGPDFPILNCGGVGGSNNDGTHAVYWTNGVNGGGQVSNCLDGDANGVPGGMRLVSNQASGAYNCYQSVTAGATGRLWIQYKFSVLVAGSGYTLFNLALNDTINLNLDGTCPTTGSTWCAGPTGDVVSGNTYAFAIVNRQGSASELENGLYINNAWVMPDGTSTPATPTPAPATATPTLGASTATAAAQATLTAIAADYTATPIPIPGAQSTPIATSTECPGGCAVAALTAIPGLATRVLVDTSPFSELTHLSLARNGCKAFGYVQIPMPVIHGTPVLGSTTPLSITWTLPVTHDWDNTNPYSNTAIQPCAMNEIPTFVWDLTYWFSVFAIFTVWIMWLLGFVGRFSGDENING